MSELVTESTGQGKTEHSGIHNYADKVERTFNAVPMLSEYGLVAGLPFLPHSVDNSQ